MARIMEHPEWAERAEYANYKARLAHRDAFNQDIESVMVTRTTDEWMARFAGQVPAAPVYDVAQALENEFVAQRGAVVEARKRDGRTVRNVACPIRVSGDASPERAAPDLGADTDDLLAQAGLTSAQIDFLRSHGVI
jgi:crotonobetainyl-CoA:carnitine CoA-transferase CaiB-like acyl-CoA transferase